MNTPWPEWLVNSFAIANQPQFATNERAFYGPYQRLLYHLFGVDGPFEITSQYSMPPHGSIDLVALFTVQLYNHPVFFIEIKPPASFPHKSKRQEADHQIRQRLHSLRNNIVTPRLPGISAFGTRMAFYEYVAATNTVTPREIPFNYTYVNNVAPAERWNYDILEANGIAKMRQVVENVKAMCRALNH